MAGKLAIVRHPVRIGGAFANGSPKSAPLVLIATSVRATIEFRRDLASYCALHKKVEDSSKEVHYGNTNAKITGWKSEPISIHNEKWKWKWHNEKLGRKRNRNSSTDLPGSDRMAVRNKKRYRGIRFARLKINTVEDNNRWLVRGGIIFCRFILCLVTFWQTAGAKLSMRSERTSDWDD